MSVLKWLERHIEEMICCICLAVIAVSVFAQVAARYVFDVALHWTEEVAAISMVWAVYMGASLCIRERFHIRIMVVVSALPAAMARAMIILADLCWALFSLFMLKISWDYLAVLWTFTTKSPSLGIDQFYPQSILFIGYAAMLYRLIQIYVLWLGGGAKGLPGMLDEDGDRSLEDEEAHI
ncbi:TRAP transporter small permease [Fluviibacterium sp. DFM31]|uniref:TRAP transporter small permease protein n=1 Tax=Meridianimarinicoccus marinus TaxID=3231483 RepID=A0ABV3LBC9_9RHOB